MYIWWSRCKYVFFLLLLLQVRGYGGWWPTMADPTMPSMQGGWIEYILLNEFSIHERAASLPTQSINEWIHPGCLPVIQSVESSSSTETTAHVYSISRIPSQLLYILPASNYFDALQLKQKYAAHDSIHRSTHRSVPFALSYAPTRPGRREDYPFS